MPRQALRLVVVFVVLLLVLLLLARSARDCSSFSQLSLVLAPVGLRHRDAVEPDRAADQDAVTDVPGVLPVGAEEPDVGRTGQRRTARARRARSRAAPARSRCGAPGTAPSGRRGSVSCARALDPMNVKRQASTTTAQPVRAGQRVESTPMSEAGGGRRVWDLTGYQWTVVFAAWLGWGFDVFDGLLFNFVAPNCVPTLLGLPIGLWSGVPFWSSFGTGRYSSRWRRQTCRRFPRPRRRTRSARFRRYSHRRGFRARSPRPRSPLSM